MTIWYAQGFVTAPTGPDSSPRSYGYDNGGFFGPAFANLGGDPFLVTWTATDCNCYGEGGPVSGAILSINGVSLDLNAQHNILASAWLDHTPGAAIQMQTLWQQTATSPPFATTFYGTQYTLSTTQLYANGQGAGAVTLLADRQFPTNLFLTVSHMGPTAVPLPAMDSGLPGLLAIALVGGWLWWRRHAA